MKVEAKIIHNWKSYQLGKGDLSLACIALGGRIISLKYQKEEFFFVQEKHAGETFDFQYLKEKDLGLQQKELASRIWGGERTLPLLPKDQSYPLVLDASPHDIKIISRGTKNGSGSVLQSPIDEKRGLQIKRELSFLSDQKFEIRQKITNISDKSIECGICNTSLFSRNLNIYLPIPQANLKSNSKSDAKKLFQTVTEPIHSKWSKIRCDGYLDFSYLANLSKGVLHIFKKRNSGTSYILLTRNFSISKNAKYLNDNVVEVMNSHLENFVQVSVHSPLQLLEPKKSIEDIQKWSFASVEREDIKEFPK